MPNSSMPHTAPEPATATAGPPPGDTPNAIVGWRWAPAWILAYVALLFAPHKPAAPTPATG